MSTLRELVLDTETTGFSPESGDRIVEVGVVELINHIATEKSFHKYINPERSMPTSAFKVHGLSYEFLVDKPLFSEIADDLLAFIGDDKIIIHNAPFDVGFLNYELALLGKGPMKESQVLDSLAMAREKYPGSPASLDALCRRFSIDNSDRSLHGALLDSHILSKVYLELIGGKQPNLLLDGLQEDVNLKRAEIKTSKTLFNREKPLNQRASEKEINDHKKFITNINGLKNWAIYN